MANTITLKDFFSRHDFVRCDAWEIIRNEEFDFDSWRLCPQSELDLDRAYNFWVTSMSSMDCEYYHKTYGLKFIHCDTLGVYVFVNDLCCGMAYEDCKLKPIEEAQND